jgi:hypothetical protein
MRFEVIGPEVELNIGDGMVIFDQRMSEISEAIFWIPTDWTDKLWAFVVAIPFLVSLIDVCGFANGSRANTGSGTVMRFSQETIAERCFKMFLLACLDVIFSISRTESGYISVFSCCEFEVPVFRLLISSVIFFFRVSSANPVSGYSSKKSL